MTTTQLNSTKQNPLDTPVVVIGSGLAGWSIVKEFRKLDSVTPILMVTAESGDFYAKPALSNALAHKKGPEQLVTTDAKKMVSTLGVTLLQNTVVTKIDAATQKVETSVGNFGYRQLVLATGANAVTLPIEGDGASEVVSVNSLADYAALRTKLVAGARVLIIGAGLIGCEFANDLGGAGFEVHIVDPNPGPLSSLLPVQASELLKTALSKVGVHWHLQTSVESITRESRNGLCVTLSNKEQLAVDVVLSAVGLRAQTELAKLAGAVCDRGVIVDSKLQTTLPNVFALGDNTQYAQISAGGVSRPLPYVIPIMYAAKALAQTLVGQPTDVIFPLMPVVVKTPALPIVLVPPAPAVMGEWSLVSEGIWNYAGEDGMIRGFLLMGSQTSQRAAQLKRIAVS